MSAPDRLVPGPGTPVPASTTARGVGLVGLGAMGRPMALHLARAAAERGTELVVTTRRPATAAAALAAGARWAATPRELAARCDVVVAMVPDLPDVRAVTDGEDGLLAGVAGPTVLVVGATVSPQGVRDLGGDLRARSAGRLRLVDAPVSGGVEGAAAATLSIMVGGDPEDVARAEPWLRALGRPVHLGPLGSGEVAKACNQLVVAATTAALGEAAVVAERAGLDLAALLDLLGSGYAGSRLLEVKKDKLVAHDHSPASPARFMIKDLAFAAEAAEGAGVVPALLPALRELYAALTTAGLGDLDSTVVQRYLDEHSPD
ncbi:NAD(P)-dependent oxidoreductase [Georgenia sp. M64]|uniref:NAD(P)-dependent oxidoreductase n=1 Tax=Georgenia sp. M64 TaxID=3120520 RepID=UPI0030E495BF